MNLTQKKDLRDHWAVNIPNTTDGVKDDLDADTNTTQGLIYYWEVNYKN